MSMRRSMSRSSSRKSFRSGNKTHPDNFKTAMRGGYRK